MRIEKLSPEQVARFPEFVLRWTAVGLSTERADRPRAEAAIRRAYAVGGHRPPERIVWCGSPLSKALTRAIVLNFPAIVGKSVWQSVRESAGKSVWQSVRESVGDSVWDSVGESVWDRVGNSVWQSVQQSVGESVWDSVQESVGDSVWDSVRQSVWDSVEESVWQSAGKSVWQSVRESVRESVRGSVRESVRGSVGNSVWDAGYGQHDAAWLAYFAFFRDVCGLHHQTDKLAALDEIARTAGWWLPYEHICWVSERHNSVHRDDRGRLHCATGPALTYPDGWSIYHWHGVRVPAWVIDAPADTLTREQVFGVANVEQRRVLIERLGAEAFLEIAKPTVLHADTAGNGDRRRLLSVDLPSDPDHRLVAVEVRCPSTGRHYLLRVPPRMSSCQQAVAWTFGIKAPEYRPLVET